MNENEKEPPKETTGFRFGIRTLLWVTAVLSVAMALLGPGWGLFLGAVVIMIHALRQSYLSVASFLLILLLCCSIIFLLLPWIATPYSTSVRNQSSNRLKQLALGIHNYHAWYGHFPPPFSTDDKGQPLHSWRTHILPFVEENALYDSIQRDEAWDSPANKQLFEGLDLPFLRSPREPARKASLGETHYLAIVDEETVWPLGKTITLDDMTDDGTANTIILIEVAGREIPWYEPRDLTLNEAINLLVSEGNNEWIRPGYFVSDRLQGDGFDDRLVAYVNGRVESIPTGSLDRKTARAFLTRSGGEDHARSLNRTSHREPRVIGHIVHWGRILGTAVFVVLAIGPFFTQRKTV